MGAKLTKWLVILLFLPAICLAEVISVKETAPEVYVVQKGDTLWGISNMYLDRPWLWPELWRNNVQITNPHLIFPGDELRLSYNDAGEPVLAMVRDVAKPEIKMSPQGRKIVKQQEAIPALPWSVIQPYIENDMILSQQEYDFLPHLLGNHDGAERFANGDLVLSKGDNKPAEAYSIVRKQNEIFDQYKNLLGLQVRHVADASPLPNDLGNELLVKVKQSNFEAKRGDKLIAKEETQMPSLTLVAAQKQRGNIVDSLVQHSLLGKFDVVVVSLGQGDVSAGTVMGIYMQGPKILDGEDPQYEDESSLLLNGFGRDEIIQPNLKVGELVIFKTFDKASYALIVGSTKIIRQGALVAKP